MAIEINATLCDEGQNFYAYMCVEVVYAFLHTLDCIWIKFTKNSKFEFCTFHIMQVICELKAMCFLQVFITEPCWSSNSRCRTKHSTALVSLFWQCGYFWNVAQLWLWSQQHQCSWWHTTV